MTTAPLSRISPMNIAATEWLDERRAAGMAIPPLRSATPPDFVSQFGSVSTTADGWHYGWMQMGCYYYLLDGPGYDETTGGSMSPANLAKHFGWAPSPEVIRAEIAYMDSLPECYKSATWAASQDRLASMLT